MVRGGTRIWLWWAAFVVYAIVSLAPARGLVLCIGEDGHFALEAATTEASCSDCLPDSAAADGCCGDADEQGSDCSCSDILLFADNPKLVRTVAPGPFDLPIPLSVGANFISNADAPSRGGLELRARSTLPPGTRVPTTLILRV